VDESGCRDVGAGLGCGIGDVQQRGPVGYLLVHRQDAGPDLWIP